MSARSPTDSGIFRPTNGCLLGDDFGLGISPKSQKSFGLGISPSISGWFGDFTKYFWLISPWFHQKSHKISQKYLAILPSIWISRDHLRIFSAAEWNEGDFWSKASSKKIDMLQLCSIMFNLSQFQLCSIYHNFTWNWLFCLFFWLLPEGWTWADRFQPQLDTISTNFAASVWCCNDCWGLQMSIVHQFPRFYA